MFNSFSFKIHILQRLRRTPKALPAQSDSTISEHRSIQLPTDILEQIIDTIALLESISERSQALRSCALTCKAWLPRSQYNLFRCARYNIPGTLHERVHVCYTPMIPVFIMFPFRRPKAPAIAPPGPSVFDTLDNAPYLQHLVKEIEVLLPSDPCQSPELWNSPSPYAFLAGKLKLTPLGRCSQLSLPALTTLRFVGFYQDAATLQMIANGASLDFFGVTATWFPTVTTLELRHIIFNHSNQFAWLVASFVNLRNLECKHIHWGPFGNFDFYGRRLAIEPCTISRLRLEGLNEYEETSRLYRDRDAGPLLAAVASSLVDLTIDAAELLRPPSSIANVLEPLKSMLTLRVQWLLTGSRTGSEERIKTSARALVNAGHPYLETLVLHVDTRLSSNPHEELAALGGELDDALASGSKFPALQVVALHLEVKPCESSTPQWLEDTLQTAFPRTCYDAGLMRLCGSWKSEPCHQ